MIFSLINLKSDIREITYILDDILLTNTETYFQIKMVNCTPKACNFIYPEILAWMIGPMLIKPGTAHTESDVINKF